MAELVKAAPHSCGRELPFPDLRGEVYRCSCGRLWAAVCPGNPAYNRWRRVGWIERRLRGLS